MDEHPGTRHPAGSVAVIPLPESNTITRPYRGLSIQDVDFDLKDEHAIILSLVGREVYRRTDWLLLCNADDRALVSVRKESLLPLFSPVVEARVLALPPRVVWIEDPLTDVGSATALASAAEAHRRSGVDAYAVKGKFEHVNVIWRPSLLRVVVTEVVPPSPAKLHEMARQALAFDEDLPPLDLRLDTVDIEHLARTEPAGRYLLPCRGSGVDLPGSVSFLDTRPEVREDWLLIGCQRSMQFHEHFYGDTPPQIDLCPRRRAMEFPETDLVLTKCCLIERGVQIDGRTAVVPWGSNLDEVRLALRLLAGLDAPGVPTRITESPSA
jgi:hypothetical protein